MSEAFLRSLLFVPGNDARKLEKAGSVGADLVVIDLEDAVAETEKTVYAAPTAKLVVAVEAL